MNCILQEVQYDHIRIKPEVDKIILYAREAERFLFIYLLTNGSKN